MIVGRWRGATLAVALGVLAACGGGSSAPPATNHAVTISWQANHEKGVHAPGGGYRLVLGGRAPLDLPYPSPTSITTVLSTGSYGVSVRAFQLDPEGAGTTFGAPATLTVVVP